MSKRKQAKDDDSDEGNSSDVSLIDVDFDFFNPNPAVDYLALKRLLIRLFQSDADFFSLNELAELILSQSTLGTSVKTDGIESDPYAYLSVLNMHVHQNHASIKALAAYILSKSAAHSALHSALQALLGPEGLQSQNHVGFVFSERLINMPVQVVPPMYRMLADEIRLANEEQNKLYTFTHYLILTRTYRLTPEQAAELENSPQRPSKRHKNKPPAAPAPLQGTGPSTYSFHPEDEHIQKYAAYVMDYPLTSQAPREDAFGFDMGGRMMLVPADKFQTMIDEMSTAYSVER
ncbi:hypothetical protein EW145_g1221 [Phellinidium pouzarii]|uniref:Protein BCP1 n=1 Tax=Phellinidium pouzarii TaxID=167371 RepID=A0A4S4LF93_9AGAM|nr:hypothetical protein EW145_g1221 [Phellinidium pouzarii]